MKKNYILYTALMLFIAVFTPNLIYSQCIACFQSPNGCSTEAVKDGGYSLGCGCMNGCKCYGEVCGDNTLPEMETMNLEQIDDSVIDQLYNLTPVEGLKIKLSEFAKSQFESSFNENGIVDNEASFTAMFHEKLGAIRLSDSEFMIYRTEGNMFTVSSCNGEVMFVAKKE